MFILFIDWLKGEIVNWHSQNYLCDSSLKWLVSPGFFAHGHYGLTYTANPPNPGVVTNPSDCWYTCPNLLSEKEWHKAIEEGRAERKENGHGACVREYSNAIIVNYTLCWVVVDFWWRLRLCSPQQTNRPKRTHNTSYQSVKEISCCTPCSFCTVVSVKNIGCRAVIWQQSDWFSAIIHHIQMARSTTLKLSGFLIPSQWIYLCTAMITDTPAEDWCDGVEIEHCGLTHLFIIWAIKHKRPSYTVITVTAKECCLPLSFIPS